MTSLKTSIKTITYLSDTGCLEIQGASLQMKKLSFKEKLEIVRNIIRESLSGNAAFALLVYSLLHSLPIKTFADLFVTILLFIAIIAVVIWLFLIIYVYFCELFRSHWIAVWFILWSVVINLTIGFGIYDKLAPVISLMK